MSPISENTTDKIRQIASPALPAIPGGWTEQVFAVGTSQLRVAQPANPDAFLDDPAVQAAHDRDAYMPYWPYLWPASHAMAEAIVREEWMPGERALEIGAGIGFVGLAALTCGLQVTFSDYAADAVNLALHNARANGFINAVGLLLDWRKPLATRYPVILGCDVIYETANHESILNLLDAMLTEGGVCWLGDAGRQHGGTFFHKARERAWQVELSDENGQPLSEPVVGRFQLLRLRRAK